MYKTSLFIFLLLTGRMAFSQQTIQGKVVDAASRQPLEAAVITEAGEGAQVLTTEGGHFTIKTKSVNPTLAVSSIGYKPATVQAGGAAVLLVALYSDALSLAAVTLQTVRMNRFSTISKIDLNLKPVRNTQELLQLVPGLFIAQHAGGGKAEQIFLRGFDSDHGTDVAVSVDGMPVNMVSHAHGQGYADAHFIIPETVNNIDFGAGPYYAQQGNLNTAGYVAFSTYKNIDASRVQVEAGRYNTYRALAMIDLLKKARDKQSAYIATDYYYTNGPTVNPQNFRRFNAFGKYNLAISPYTQLTAQASTFSSNWDASGQVPERAVAAGIISRFGSIDPSEGGNTERHNARVAVAHNFRNGTTWENSAWYSRYRFNLYSNFTFFVNNPVEGDEIQQAEKRHLAGYLSKLSHTYNLNRGSVQTTYAAGVRYDATENSTLANVVKRRFISNTKLGDINEANVYAFADGSLAKGRWLISGGLRYDYLHFKYFDKLSATQAAPQGKSIVSPKLNLQYTLSKAVQLYVKSGKGFHSNDTRVVVAQAGEQILPAAYGADLGLTLKPTPSLIINAAAWYLYLAQEFVYVGDDGNVEPSGKTRRQGIDLLVRYQLSPALFANINLNLTRPRAIGEPKGQDYIPLAPTTTSTGGLFYKKKEGFNGGLTYRYISSRPANEDNSIVAKGYFLADASVNYTRRRYEVGLAIENIFDVDWNEAQFATESRLQTEPAPVSELNFTPGTPVFARLKLAVFF